MVEKMLTKALVRTSALIGAVMVTAASLSAVAAPARTLVTRNASQAKTSNSSPSLFRTVHAAPPAACRAANLRVRVPATASGTAGSAVTLALSTAGRPCSLATGGWPTIRLHLANGTSPMAKAYAYSPAGRSSQSALTTFATAGTERTVLRLSKGAWSPAALFATTPAAGAKCARLTSLTVYPTALGTGAGHRIRLPSAAMICGTPRVLPYLARGPATGIRKLVTGALAAADATHGAGMAPADDSPTGFWYGSDGAATMACGSGPYYNVLTSEPCASSNGYYGGYFGEIGKWDIWKGCDFDGQAWNGSDVTDAFTNWADYSKGVSANGYWMTAGPGRDPNYDGTTAEASSWGKYQAEAAATDAGNKSSDLSYLAADIEQYTHLGSLDNGWNTVWSNECGSTVTSTSIASSVDLAVVNEFESYLWANTAYWVMVYSSGGSDAYEWGGIFGSLQDSWAEWTYNDETSDDSTYPTGWSVGSVSAKFFGGVNATNNADCKLAWQWTGGSVSNGDGLRLDQIDGPNFYDSSCE